MTAPESTTAPTADTNDMRERALHSAMVEMEVPFMEAVLYARALWRIVGESPHEFTEEDREAAERIGLDLVGRLETAQRIYLAALRAHEDIEGRARA